MLNGAGRGVTPFDSVHCHNLPSGQFAPNSHRNRKSLQEISVGCSPASFLSAVAFGPLIITVRGHKHHVLYFVENECDVMLALK